MSKNYKIYVDADPGPRLIEITAKLIEPLTTVDTVRFESWPEITESKTGVFIPEKREIVISLGNVLNNYDLHRMGMFYIAGIWFTALWTIMHEVIHAKELEKNPNLEPTDEHERLVQAETKKAVIEYTSQNTIPPIEEWGWLTEQITDTVNALYEKGDTALLDELDMLKIGAVAKVDTILNLYQFNDPPQMYKAILDGEFGLKEGSDYYLTANDFFGLDQPLAKIARTAQTVYME